MRRARLLLAAAILGVIAPVGLAAADPACAADGELRVAVVVDLGPLQVERAAPSAACVSVPQGASAADVLEARARALGTPPPRYDDSGLLCAIDGLPERGCGEPTAGGYRYWSYWQGSDAGWTYASEGPATREASAAATEGWRFVDGAGMPSDPPPRGSALPSEVCVQAQTIARRSVDAGSDEPLSGVAIAAGLAVVLAGTAWWTTRRRARADR